MAVTLAQFRIEFPEFEDVADALIQPRLDDFDTELSGFDDLHDRAVYARTALELNDTVWGMNMAPNQTEPDKYQRKWRRMLNMNYRRGQISGGGLT